jgi:hypothetical protein
VSSREYLSQELTDRCTVAAYFVANDTTLFSGPELHHLTGRNPAFAANAR